MGVPGHLRRRFAAGRARKQPGAMNKSEAAYAQHLETRRLAGEIRSWAYEALKLRLADRTFLTPDFFVWHADGIVECHEVKGFMEDDAAVKLKVAADRWPFRFYLVRVRAKRDGGGWEVQEL